MFEGNPMDNGKQLNKTHNALHEAKRNIVTNHPWNKKVDHQTHFYKLNNDVTMSIIEMLVRI